MKFKNYLMILFVFLAPLNVFAKDREPIAGSSVETICQSGNLYVDVCEDGCRYDDLQDAIDYIRSYGDNCSTKDVTLDIGDGSWFVNYLDIYNYRNVLIRGKGIDKTIVRFDTYTEFGDDQSITLEDFSYKCIEKNSDYLVNFYSIDEVNINNFVLDSKGSYIGIYIDHSAKAVLDNVKIINSSSFGIYNDRCKINPVMENAIEPLAGASFTPYYNSLLIKNSDLSNNTCGVFDGCIYHESGDELFTSAKQAAVEPVVGDIEHNYYTTKLENTKLSCANAIIDYDYDYDYDISPLIYIPSNNTWTNEPVYGEDIIEEGGRVIVEYEKEQTLSLKVSDGLSISNIFEQIEAEDLDWEIEDNDIAKVIDGKIVPLKVGNTAITTEVGGITYRINLKVTSDMLNPNTFNISYIIGVLLIITISAVIIFKKSVKEK